MTDNQSPEGPVRKRGRPPKHVQRKSRRDDGRTLITRNGRTFEDIPEEASDRLHVPPEMTPDGMTYLWVRASILGQNDPQWQRRREQTGWKPVPASRHDGYWMPKGYDGEINVEGLVLYELPTEFVERRKLNERKRAAEQVWVREQAMRSGDAVDVAFDSTSDKGRKANRLNKQYEEIPVPGNSYQREE
jgi:hypothetical protein